jgi:uncharacterized alkaline shock family protein YloU
VSTSFRVGETLVERLAADRARGVPGVLELRPSLLRLIKKAPDGVVASIVDGRAEVSVTIATRFGHRCADVAVDVQRGVADAVTAYTGLPTTVSVTIAEVQAR